MKIGPIVLVCSTPGASDMNREYALPLRPDAVRYYAYLNKMTEVAPQPFHRDSNCESHASWDGWLGYSYMHLHYGVKG